VVRKEGKKLIDGLVEAKKMLLEFFIKK